MRLKKLDLKPKDLQKGIKPFSSVKISAVTVLVGKNGSGKSRYLEAIERRLRRTDFRDILANNFENVPTALLNSANSAGYVCVKNTFHP